MKSLACIILPLALLAARPLGAQATVDPRLTTPEGVVSALYDAISGEPGVKRDWAFFESLFRPEGVMMVMPTAGAPPRPGRPPYIRMTPHEYATLSGPDLEKEGLIEREIHRVVERYGRVAHVTTTYESRYRSSDPRPYSRGVNFIHLIELDGRWWILTDLWDDEESSHQPIPPRYLPAPE